MNLLEIFRAGTRQDASGKTLTISDNDLALAAKNYDPEAHEAPLVIGHPKVDAPAYGWAKSLSQEGSLLFAEPQQVDAEFSEMVNSGKFKKISASFYLPGAAANPKPEGYYLRHIGFLGAQPPSVKGLKSAEFNEAEEGIVCFTEEIPEQLAEQQATEPSEQSGDDAKSQPQSPESTHSETTNEGDEMSQEDKKRLAALEKENAELKANAAAEAKKQAEAANADFCEQLINDGKLLPKNKDKALELLNAEHGTADFSEESYKTDLKAFLSELPTAVDFAEIATKDKAAETADESVEYAEGTDPERIALDQKARAYMVEHKCDYAEAIDAVA